MDSFSHVEHSWLCLPTLRCASWLPTQLVRHPAAPRVVGGTGPVDIIMFGHVEEKGVKERAMFKR